MLHDEQMILAQLLVDASFFHDLVIDSSCFLRSETRQIYNAISTCIERGVKPDLISVHDIDRDIKPEYLAKITDLTSSAVNWKHYEQKIVKAYKLYRLAKLGKTLTEESVDGDPERILGMVETELMALALDNSRTRIMKLEEYGNDFVTELKARYDSHGALRGISSGLDSVDGYTHGFLPRRLYYIGARPSQGKSALMLNMATDCAINKQIPCGIISIESSGQEIIERVFSSVGRIPGDMLASGFWGPSQFADIQTLAGKIVGKPLYLYDKPNLNIAQVKSVARVMATLFKVKIIFIDYLQLIDSTNRKLTKMEQVADASKQLKELARELELPIVCLAQLRREADDRRPGLSDFQWASQIEQDADVAMLLWHEAKDENTESWILVEKNRDGKKGSIPVSFAGEYVTFKEREE